MNKKVLIPAITIIIAALIGVIIYLLVQNNEKDQNIRAMEEMAAFEKEQLEDEYENLALQFDGYGMNIQNDSLVELLSIEQQRVRDLLEELRITKATDAKRISELKKELATVREVMKTYIAQIDSLDRENKFLVAENQQVKEQYQQVSVKAQTLEQERQVLTEVVSRASMLEIGNFRFISLNEKGKAMRHIKRTSTLEFDYSILKNITTQPGEKTVYMQIRQPNGEVLTKDKNNKFKYENQMIPFSIEKEFEYTGEQLDDVMYWTVQEVLEPGLYNADFFIDGNLCGSFAFTMEK